MAVLGGLKNSCEKKRSKKQRRKGKICLFDAEFQRIARRDKKAFFSDECKEIEEKQQNGKDQIFVKKIRDTKGTSQRWAQVKDRNSMDLTEADIKKRWQKYTEELYKKSS